MINTVGCRVYIVGLLSIAISCQFFPAVRLIELLSLPENRPNKLLVANFVFTPPTASFLNDYSESACNVCLLTIIIAYSSRSRNSASISSCATNFFSVHRWPSIYTSTFAVRPFCWWSAALLLIYWREFKNFWTEKWMRTSRWYAHGLEKMV